MSETSAGGRAPSAEPDVTELLRSWANGDHTALERLMPLVYGELRQLARRQMRGERDGHTLQTTALVSEAYLRLVDLKRVRWQDRAHFLAISARLMRRILVDHARSRRYQKRGGGRPTISIEGELLAAPERGTDLVALDDALETLAAIDERKSRVVELRYFGGLTLEETAAALRVSPETVTRDWRMAKAWLRKELHREPA